MRKLKLQVQLSLDGFVGGTKGELDWMTWNWDDSLKNKVDQLTDSIDTILLGRKMSDGFISYWAQVATDPGNEAYPFAQKMVHTPKYIFSKTLTETAYPNTSVLGKNLKEDVLALKNKPGKDIIVYGGAEFNTSLIKENLIDDFYLFVNPTAIGKGLSIFSGLKALKLISTEHFECGIVLLHYQLN